ncbi:hypothetical protein QMK61_14435 [Fulvimonas sp. R45]|uniref:hypothetical protein n=1 Tax=Fulvimonas sp. R45 TaxID=3045937 RepID=UPI00265E1E87|nr:hypothetical protein [Fulvimonas sp. R45]MDO1530035.1 hypothetical protein [Fulvimonas sp. R45]
MNCPECQNSSVPFTRVWLVGGSGALQCTDCGAHLRLKLSHLKLSMALRILAACLGVTSVVLGFRFQSWLVFAAIFALSLAVSASVTLRFGRLERDSRA